MESTHAVNCHVQVCLLLWQFLFVCFYSTPCLPDLYVIGIYIQKHHDSGTKACNWIIGYLYTSVKLISIDPSMLFIIRKNTLFLQSVCLLLAGNNVSNFLMMRGSHAGPCCKPPPRFSTLSQFCGCTVCVCEESHT